MNVRTPPPRRFTRAEFDRIALSGGFGDLRVELRRGWIVEMSPQFTPHARMKARFNRAFDGAIRNSGLRLEVLTEVSIAFQGDFEPMPDVAVFSSDLVSELERGPLPAAAVRLVVEIAVSSLDDDLGDKLLEYAEAGLPEYWVVDVAAHMLIRHAEPSPNGYARREATPLSAGAASLTIPALVLAPGSVG